MLGLVGSGACGEGNCRGKAAFCLLGKSLNDGKRLMFAETSMKTTGGRGVAGLLWSSMMIMLGKTPSLPVNMYQRKKSEAFIFFIFVFSLT